MTTASPQKIYSLISIMTELPSLALVKTFVQSVEDFPVDFDDAWQWVGYSSKQKALEALQANFIKGLDFLTLGLKSPRGGRPGQNINVTVDCFKAFCMMAGTPKGREVREYFLKCERSLKQPLQQQAPIPPTQDILPLLAEMSEVVESHINASQSLNRAIHTAIHQQTDTLKSAFEKTKSLHQKTLALPAQQSFKELTNLVQLTPRLTSREKRDAVNRFLDLIDTLPSWNDRRDWSSRKIGEYLGVSYRTVLYIREERSGKRQPPKYSD